MNGEKSRSLRTLAKLTAKNEGRTDIRAIYQYLKAQYKQELKTVNQK